MSAARIRRSSIAAKSRRARIRRTAGRAGLCFTGTVVIGQSRTAHPLSGSLPRRSITQTSLGASAAWETGPGGVLGREYNLVEKVSVMRGLMDMFAVMYPQLQVVDLRNAVPTLEVPYY